MTTAKESLVHVTQDEWGVCDPRDRSTVGVEGHYSVAVSTGDESEAILGLGYRGGSISTGVHSLADVQGYQSCAAASGQESIARTHGTMNVAMALSMKGLAIVGGTHSLAVAWGDQATAQGDLGCWLLLTEWGIEPTLQRIQLVQVDGAAILPQTPYRLKDGCIVRVFR